MLWSSDKQVRLSAVSGIPVQFVMSRVEITLRTDMLAS